MEGALRARRPPAKAVSLYLCPHLRCNRRLDTSEALSCLRSQLSFAQLDAQVWVRQNKAATLADFQKLRSENVIHDRPHRCAQPHADSMLVRASLRVRIDVFYIWAQRDAPCSQSIMAGMGLLPPILRACPPALRSRMLFYMYISTRRTNSSTSCRLLVWPNHVSSEFGASGEPVFDSAGTHHGHMQIAYSYTLSLWPCVRFVHYGRSATCDHASRLGFSFACVIAIHAYAFHFFAWAASQVSAGGSLCR
jgi:hypothetical protein